MSVGVIICTEDDVLPWPSCTQLDPPEEHEPVRTNPLRDRLGRFQRAFYCCERCDRARGVVTALDDLRRALSTVERWRDEATPLPWFTGASGVDVPAKTLEGPDADSQPVARFLRGGDASLILSAVSVLLDEGSGVTAILQDAIEHYGARWEPEGWKMPDATAMRLAELVNRIEATR